MRAVAGARWPELERLHLMDADGYHGFLDLLSRDDLATLGELALVGVPVRRREHRDAFPNLVRIDVSQTFVSDTGVQLLRRLAPEVIARDRRRGPG